MRGLLSVLVMASVALLFFYVYELSEGSSQAPVSTSKRSSASPSPMSSFLDLQGQEGDDVGHESPAVEDLAGDHGPVAMQVALPLQLQICSPAVVTFSAGRSLTYRERVDLMDHLAVELFCSRNESKNTFHKVLPAFPSPESLHQLKVFFYPDDGVSKCTLKALSTSFWVSLEGQIEEKEFNVGPFPFTSANLYNHCRRESPLIVFFVVY